MYSRTKTLLFIEHYCIINKIGNFSEYQKPPVISVSLILPEVSRKADDGTRTRDLLTTNEVRYHLCHISLFAELYFARHALLYYFPNVLSTPFLSFFIFIKKDINLALRLYKELNCVKIHVICSCYFNSQSVFSRSLTCRK